MCRFQKGEPWGPVKRRLPRKKRRADNKIKHRTPSYAEYMQSDAWKRKKQAAFRFHGRSCRRCGSQTHLEVHHNYYGRLGKELMSDLEILCSDCHELHHMQDQAWRKKHRR